MGTKYFSGETELVGIRGLDNAKFAAQFPGVTGRRFDSFQRLVGYGPDRNTMFAVERTVNFKSNPSRHECDARCFNATGRTMNCECSCGGKNHGRGAFNCEAVAA